MMRAISDIDWNRLQWQLYVRISATVSPSISTTEMVRRMFKYRPGHFLAWTWQWRWDMCRYLQGYFYHDDYDKSYDEIYVVIGYDISNHDHDNRDDEMCSDLYHFLSFPTYYVSSHRNAIWRYACSKGKGTMIKMQIQINLVTMRCTFFGQEVLGLIFWIKKIKSSW
jgi:hypothetical protein